jgi:dTMP kinase
MGGLFVTFEGPEGGGKSTQLALLGERLETGGYAVCRLREPGGTALGDRLRALLLHEDDLRTQDRAEALLYAAARSQLVVERIRPALESGGVVLCDRYADSTLAYQGYGRGLPLDELTQVQRFAMGDLWPDLTVLLDLPVAVGLERKRAAEGTASGEWTRYEAEAREFHEHVRAGYRALAEREPRRWLVLDARAPVDTLHAAIFDAVRRRLPPSPLGTSG